MWKWALCASVQRHKVRMMSKVSDGSALSQVFFTDLNWNQRLSGRKENWWMTNRTVKFPWCKLVCEMCFSVKQSVWCCLVTRCPFRTRWLCDSLLLAGSLCCVQVSPLPSNMSESVCSLKFAQRVRSVELSSSSSSSRRHENSSTSSSPTHDSVEVTHDAHWSWLFFHQMFSDHYSSFYSVLFFSCVIQSEFTKLKKVLYSAE